MNPLATPDRIAFIGDLHADVQFGAQALEYATLDRGANVAIQLGDFGFWADWSLFLETVSIAAQRLAIPLLVVDGNHEQHTLLRRRPLDSRTGLRPLAQNVWHLPRGYRWTWNGVRFLALGGAHSVDRRRRTAGFDWFPEERISAEEAREAIAGGHADVMVTHDAPTGAAVPGLRPESWPAEEIRSADGHRLLLQQVVDDVRPQSLFHGHYHIDYTAELLGDGYRCTVRGLAHNEIDGPLSRAVFVTPLRHLARRAESTLA